MILDTSAIVAILFSESDAETYARAIDEADSCRISAANFVEAAIVAMPPHSTLATASLTPSPKSPANHSSSRATTSK